MHAKCLNGSGAKEVLKMSKIKVAKVKLNFVLFLTNSLNKYFKLP